MTESVVVVGGGLAAAKAVETLRKEGFDGPLLLIGDEKRRPYERPGLSKEVLQGHAEPDSLYVHGPDYYRDAGIEVRLGDPAVALDREGRHVRLSSGERVRYARLILAAGSRPRTIDLPGSHLQGVLTLRNWEDSLALRASLKPGRRVTLVGGGWIGLEVAAAASLAGCEVTVFERSALPLAGVLGDRIAGHFARLHEAHGVRLRTRASLLGFEGRDGHVTGVRDADGIIAADLVVVGVGAIPNVGLAQDAGLAVGSGVLVDEHLRTDDHRIWAAGDVAEAYNTALGRRVRVEHWDNARRQGRLAGLSVLGRPNVYDWQPYFFTDQYDLSMEYVGLAARDAEVVLRGDPEEGAFIAFWLESGRVTAAMNVNVEKVNPTLRKVVGSTVDPGRLADPGVPLAELAPALG